VTSQCASSPSPHICCRPHRHVQPSGESRRDTGDQNRNKSCSVCASRPTEPRGQFSGGGDSRSRKVDHGGDWPVSGCRVPGDCPHGGRGGYRGRHAVAGAQASRRRPSCGGSIPIRRCGRRSWPTSAPVGRHGGPRAGCEGSPRASTLGLT
jgi:hypothetical protein